MFDNREPYNEEANDYFDGPDIQEPPQAPRKINFKPEDPDYWDEEESEWEHLMPRPGVRKWMWITLILICGTACGAIWVWFFTPYVTEASQFGYVEGIEHRGTLFPTYEGVLIPYREMKDTTRIYDRNFEFTARDKQTALKVKKALLGGYPVRVEYKRYHTVLPWRGSTPVVVVEVDSVDPSIILPPEFTPKDPSFTREPSTGTR